MQQQASIQISRLTMRLTDFKINKERDQASGSGIYDGS